MLINAAVGIQNNAAGATPPSLAGDRQGALFVSELNARYYSLAAAGKLFMAQAIVTAPVIYTTAAGTGGPLLWNGSTSVNAAIIAVSIGVSTVTTVAATMGLTWNTGQSVVPTATTAIDGRSNMLVGGAASNCTPYRVGTVLTAGASLLPFANLHTGALTVDNVGTVWVDIGGAVVVPPGAWVSPAASATASTTVATIGMIWAELPV
jgi:hypothetical protein